MARTNKDRKFYIAVDGPSSNVPLACPNDMDRTAFEAIANWRQVGSVGSIGESGMSTNIVSYDTLDTDVTQKAKGISDAGSPTVEVARVPTDGGQIAMRAAAATNFNYAFRVEDSDAPSVGYTNSVYYNRGMVSGPTRPGGRAEDFILEVYTLALNQREVVVDPEAIGS